MIVPGGGHSLDGARWVAARSNFLVHVKVLARLFRGKMLAMLMHAHNADELKFFNAHAGLADNRTFKRFIAPLRRIKWVVYCRAPFAGPKQVLHYLSVTPTASPSQTAASLQPTTRATRGSKGDLRQADWPRARAGRSG